MIKKPLARLLLRISGWSIAPDFPPEYKRCVMIAAPHTSNWDAFFLICVFVVLEVPLKFTIKKEWTEHWLLGGLLRKFGGVGIDRNPNGLKPDRDSYVDIMADVFNKYEKVAMVIAAEGTRRRATKWKLGFYHTARKAGVPITFGYLDYKKKIAGVGGPLYLSDNMDDDLRKVMNFYADIAPKHRDKFALDSRYYP